MMLDDGCQMRDTGCEMARFIRSSSGIFYVVKHGGPIHQRRVRDAAYMHRTGSFVVGRVSDPAHISTAANLHQPASISLHPESSASQPAFP